MVFLEKRDGFIPKEDIEFERELRQREAEEEALRQKLEEEKREAEEKQRAEYEKTLQERKIELVKLRQGVIEESDVIKEVHEAPRKLTVGEKISGAWYRSKWLILFVGRLDDNLAAVDQSTVTHCITADLPWENTTGGYRVTEGPTVIKRDGVYHLFYSANDFRNPDYAVGHATATSPYGPWTKSPEPVITRRDIGVNGTGHGDMFVDGVGALRYVFHTHNSDSKVSPRLTWIVTLDPVTFRPVPGSARSLTVE